MKKITKILGIFIVLLMLTGCLTNMSPSEKVEEMFNQYIQNDESIMKELDEYLLEQNLNEEERNRYKEIMKDVYKTLKYTIVNEDTKDTSSTVEVNITVKDLFDADTKAEDYLMENPNEFYIDGRYDNTKFIDYKLSILETSDKTVDYTVYITLSENNGIWDIDDLSNETLEKINGIYDYTKEQN